MAERSAPRFVVIPEFRVRLEVKAAFLDAALDDARHSVGDEAGCHQFDVVCPEGAEDIVLFYEVYDDRAAFDEHLGTPHLKRFQAAMKALDVEETVVRFATLKHS
ncbi:antibiotic biosynthesis monooxygenase [Mesorhizobium sp. M4A.F.Ca.ET.050.02.1.1]|uniref:putative quinol monooxygenase n=1 Tax=Mesorhizobium sp. M4A.F.Ca.ET.050.02.1.1 TaxID=2496754 RepID=UPI000FCB941A|nr:putative quinol monooxygenase [Mesorhizobium sp. M4A.F.Ca.ET.050.02.1.1]RUX52050.1 antibiotic biosynthesis monooxygenase [Mesorhizobium sp. M4A.F.Ca.ET.050.02.1.1]TIT81060.1 MAG: antibiotic biosynthesis monooxygenase [Mesorhizobium sp.]